MFDMVSDMIFVWTLDGDRVFCINSKTNRHKGNNNKNGNLAMDIPLDGTSFPLFPGRIGMSVFSYTF